MGVAEGLELLGDCSDKQSIGPDGVFTVKTFGHLVNCSAVIYTMRVLFTGGLWPEDWAGAALLRAEPVDASSAHDRLRPLLLGPTVNVLGRAPIAAPVLLPNLAWLETL